MMPAVRRGLIRPRQDDEFFGDVINGLASSPKAVPSKWLWDEHGTRLFEQLGEAPEHYLVRAERDLLEQHAMEIAGAIGQEAMLVELGEGQVIRARGWLDMRESPLRYVPIEPNARAGAAIRNRSPIHDFEPNFANLVRRESRKEGHTRPGRRTAVLVGGTLIGSFPPHEAASLLARAALMAGRGGCVLVAVDLKKARRTIEAAYDDRRGIFATFNRNLLVRINREIGATFDITSFRHSAPYDPIRGRVEMRLVSEVAQTVLVGGYGVQLARGERIVTAHWYKYDLREFQQLARRAGLEPVHAWTDDQHRMSLHGLTVR